MLVQVVSTAFFFPVCQAWATDSRGTGGCFEPSNQPGWCQCGRGTGGRAACNFPGVLTYVFTSRLLPGTMVPGKAPSNTWKRKSLPIYLTGAKLASWKESGFGLGWNLKETWIHPQKFGSIPKSSLYKPRRPWYFVALCLPSGKLLLQAKPPDSKTCGHVYIPNDTWPKIDTEIVLYSNFGGNDYHIYIYTSTHIYRSYSQTWIVCVNSEENYNVSL